MAGLGGGLATLKRLQVAGPGVQGGGMGWSSSGDQGEAGSSRCSLAAPEPHFENQSAAIVDQ